MKKKLGGPLLQKKILTEWNRTLFFLWKVWFSDSEIFFWKWQIFWQCKNKTHIEWCNIRTKRQNTTLDPK